MEKKIQLKLVISTISIVTLLILVFIFSYFIQKTENSKLGTQIQEILNNYSPDTYIVKEKLSLNNQISTIGKFYLIDNTNSKEPAYAVTIRLMGISGPVTALFLHENNFTTFIDFAGFNNIRTYDNHAINQSQLAYWEKKIDSVILEISLEEGEINE